MASWAIKIFASDWHSKHVLNHAGSNESEIAQNEQNLVNSARRKLLDQSSNLAAAPFSGAPTTEISSVPSTLSSGAFPAVPDAKKSQNQSPPPLHLPSASPHASDGNQQHSANGASGNLWLYIIIIAVVAVVVLVIVVIVILCIWRKRTAKVISPWKTGISGQLQKAFITGNNSSKALD